MSKILVIFVLVSSFAFGVDKAFEDLLKKDLVAYKQQLPARVDPNTKVLNVTYSQGKLVYFYEVNETETTQKKIFFHKDFMKAVKKAALQSVCHVQAMKTILDKDVRIEFNYRFTDGAEIGKIFLDKSDCK